MAAGKISVSKVTLGTGKVVLLREMKIRDTELAMQEVAGKANGDGNLMSFLSQKPLLRLLIVQIDGKKPSAAQLEDMDGLFSMAEYNQLMIVVKKLTEGSQTGKEPQVEMESVVENSGDK